MLVAVQIFGPLIALFLLFWGGAWALRRWTESGPQEGTRTASRRRRRSSADGAASYFDSHDSGSGDGGSDCGSDGGGGSCD
jgi:hypothetical protein